MLLSQGRKESDMIWRLNNDNKHRHNVHLQNALPEDVPGMQPSPVDLSQLCGHTSGGPPLQVQRRMGDPPPVSRHQLWPCSHAQNRSQGRRMVPG